MAKAPKLKLPPQNKDAEQSVLGSLLIDKSAIIKIADLLKSDDFYVPAHEKIYAALLELYEKHQPIDLVSVTALLTEKNVLADIGGSSYLAELTNSVPTASHVEHYARMVKEKKILRDLIQASAEITEEALAPGKDTENLLDAIEQKILSISQRSLTKTFIPIRDELKTAYERIEKLHQGEGGIRGIPTGFDALDNILSGLQRSDFIVIGARPSLGKTTLALDIARNAAAKTGLPVGIFSLEMSREQVIDRLIAAESQVSLWKLRTGRISDDFEFEMIQNALDRLSKLNIFIDDTPSPNILQVRSMGRRLQVEHGLGLIVVDYLQLLLAKTESDSIVQQVTEISRGLKALARELEVPVVAISQLSRAVDQRDHRIPRLSDLRESGAIEQDADVVLFLYRKDRDRIDIPVEEQNIAQVIVAKHRNGPLGSIQLRFDQERVTFRSIEKKYEEQGVGAA